MRLVLSNFEGLRKGLVNILILLLFSGNLDGQKLYFSNIPRLNSKAYYNKVIGENAGGVYILRFRDPDLKGGFSIERYSHNMDFIENENLELSKREYLLKVFTTDSGLVFVKLSNEKETSSITLLRTGFAIKDAKEMKTLYSSNRIEKGSDAVEVDYNIKREKIGIWISEVNKNDEREFQFLLADLNGHVLNKALYNTSSNHKTVELRQSCLSNSGCAAMIYAITRDEKRSTEPSHKEHFIVTTNLKGETHLNGMGDQKYFISSIGININEFNDRFVVSGLYDFKKPEGAHGVVSINFGAEDETLRPVFTPFDRKFVSGLIGSRLEQEGADPEKYKVRKIIPRDDAGHLLICEFFDITQQMETFYLNGVPQTSSKSVYNYNDLLLLAMDSLGNIEWRYKINKRQTSFASMAYLQSIGVYVNDKTVNIVYNDNSNQGNRVMHILLSRDGIVEQKIILNSENEYTAIIPLEGKQTGYNRYVTPVIQNRQTMLLQLVDEN